MTAAGETVLDWLVLMGWRVEVREERGELHGTATREMNGRSLRVDATADLVDSLAWDLVTAATIELERRTVQARPEAICA